MKTKLLLYPALLLLTQCSKCKNDPAPNDPASQRPPACGKAPCGPNSPK